MRVLVATQDLLLVNYIESLLRDARVKAEVFDRNLSALGGAVGPAPMRIMVADGEWARAGQILRDAGLGAWIADVG